MSPESLPSGSTASLDERPVWSGYPSWWQFLWLYFFALMTGLRAALFFRFGVPGWELWLVGTAALIGCAALLRWWGHYLVTRSRLTVKNGYTGRDIQSVALDQVGHVAVRQGPIASMTGIGTVVALNARGEEILRFRGIPEPDVLVRRINALRPVGGGA